MVDGEVPLLLPVRMLKGLKAIINLHTNMLILPEEKIHIPMHEMSSGHLTIEINNFDKEGFYVADSNAPCKTEHFQRSFQTRAMLAQSFEEIAFSQPRLGETLV